ncbi:IS4 family transposase [Robertmurraya massiliosenegalensis]|uniref:IS4 family transposase n=1 Tax=Robertmurraya massiliosenegalensis TaxID=1287657 RepID=UPI000366A81E|nr:IS4 family transposase [Robertmurraya massiliosenegalensis]
MRKSMFLEAVEVTRNVLHDFIFMCESRSKETYFTREGRNKFTFVSTILFMLNFVKKSFQIELDDYFKLIGKETESVSKQAFCEARKKIKPEAFIKLFDTIVDWYYKENPWKTFMGFRLFAVDASILEINNSIRLRDAFDVSKGSSLELARAMASCIYDIENNLIVKALITKCTEGERSVASKLINSFKAQLSSNDLFLFDRGYPSLNFFSFLIESKVKFIIRTQVSYYKSSIKASVPDQMIELKKSGKLMRLRAIRFILPSGEEELLITNIEDEKFGIQDFKILYFKRWGIETKYDELKNKLQLQKFTGDTPLSVEQDFYATMFLANMASFVKREADEMIAIEQEGKDLTYEYKTNTNVLIGKLKTNLIRLILEKSPRRRKRIYKQILDEITRSRTPIRPGRSFIRNKRLRANRNGLVQKSAI